MSFLLRLLNKAAQAFNSLLVTLSREVRHLKTCLTYFVQGAEQLLFTHVLCLSLLFIHIEQISGTAAILMLSADAENETANLTTAAKTFFTRSELRPPLGHDPTFQPASRLWDYDLIAREGKYYNTSQVKTFTS